MGFSDNRVQWICSPLVGWALVSGAVAPAWAQTSTATPDSTTPATTTTTPGTDTTTNGVPGAGGSAPSGTVPGKIVAPTTTTTTQDNGTTPGTGPQGTTPGGGTTAGSTTSNAPPPSPSAPGFAGDVNPQIAPVSLTSSTGQLLYGASAGAALPTFSGGGGPSGDDLGIPLGSFTLFPSIDITTGVDSNVFAQNNYTTAATSSPYMTVVPSLELRSNWLNHELKVALSGGFGFYSNAPTQNYQNYSIVADAKIEVHDDIYLTPSIGYKRATEALGTPNVAFAQAPTVVESVPVKLGIYQRFNRVFYEAAASATRYWFTDYSAITSAGLAGSSRDRFEYEERFRLGYELTDDVSVYIQPTINQVRYISNLNAADQQRDSNNLGLIGGATWIISPTSSIDGNIGYTSRTYPAGGLAGTDTFIASLSGTVSPYAPLTLRPTISRSIQETSLAEFKSMVLTTLGMDFTYVIHDAWTATGGLSYTLSDYTPADGTGATARTDKIFRGTFGLMYSIRPQVAIGPVIEYTSGSTTDPTNGPTYDREIFSIRLTARR
jgi:hypothetical protein